MQFCKHHSLNAVLAPYTQGYLFACMMEIREYKEILFLYWNILECYGKLLCIVYVMRMHTCASDVWEITCVEFS